MKINTTSTVTRTRKANSTKPQKRRRYFTLASIEEESFMDYRALFTARCNLNIGLGIVLCLSILINIALVATIDRTKVRGFDTMGRIHTLNLHELDDPAKQ